jgi:TatD DNase family protein
LISLFDTHSHIQESAFAKDFDAVVARAEEAGLAGIAICGYDAESNERGLTLASLSRILFPTVGFHPHEAKDVTPGMLAELESQAKLDAVKAVGEIGLDFYRDHSPHDIQRSVLDSQLAIAVRTSLPVSVHSRGAEDAVYEHLAAYAEASPLAVRGLPLGVMHCFGGTLEQAERYVALGLMVSIACSVTYPRSVETRRLASELPLDALVIETDSPYLPPQTMRGKRNEPVHVAAAAESVAVARGLTTEEVALATTANAARLFNVGVPVGASNP